jgi:hypothetical protein
MDDYDGITIIPNKPRSKTIIACSVLVILFFIWAVSYYMDATSRTMITGDTDPATHYRIRYTVSSRYRKTADLDSSTLKKRHELEEWTYTPNAPGTLRRWYYTFLLRRSDYTQPADDSVDAGSQMEMHKLQQFTYIGSKLEGHKIDSDGYVVPGDIAGIGEYVYQEHTEVSGCPATWFSFNANDKNVHYYGLYIRPRHKAITYLFAGTSSGDAETNDVLDELKEIRDSIVVEIVDKR